MRLAPMARRSLGSLGQRLRKMVRPKISAESAIHSRAFSVHYSALSRAFSARSQYDRAPWGDAPGWYEKAPLALKRYLKRPRRFASCAKPTARQRKPPLYFAALRLVQDPFCRRLARLKLRTGVSGSFRIKLSCATTTSIPSTRSNTRLRLPGNAQIRQPVLAQARS